MSSYEENLNKKLQERRKQLEDAKQSKILEKQAEREKRALTNPELSMHKLKRLVLSEDELFFVLPMHDYELGWDVLVHTHKTTGDNGKDKYSHIMCTDPLVEDSCQWCKLAMKEMAPKEDGGEKRAFSQYDPRHLKSFVMYVFNKVGAKRTFTGKEGEDVTYFINPSAVVEIQAEGKGKDNVLSIFKTFSKNKMFESAIWGVRREPGIMINGRKRSGAFAPVTTFTEEELLEKLGREGIEAKLPESAQAWADKIKAIKDQSQAREEVFRYIITAFDNSDEIAKIKQIELPTKEEKPKENTSNLLLS